jgi:hypothetical protein
MDIDTARGVIVAVGKGKPSSTQVTTSAKTDGQTITIGHYILGKHHLQLIF